MHDSNIVVLTFFQISRLTMRQRVNVFWNLDTVYIIIRWEVHVNTTFSSPNFIFYIIHTRFTIFITSYYHTIPEPQPQIIPLLLSSGFQHIALIKKCRIDPALITALVEGWRHETHTFHLSWVSAPSHLKMLNCI